MDLSKSPGSITIGKKTNFIITKNIPSYAYPPIPLGVITFRRFTLTEKL